MSIQTKNIEVKLGQLMLDPNNYRLDYGQGEKEYSDTEVVAQQQKIEKDLIKENIADLELSILTNGFLEVDKIVVRELSNLESDIKKYLVIEGNRRTSAFKSLMADNYNSKTKFFSEKISEHLKYKYKHINVVLVEGSEEEITDYSQRVMGIRHIAGPKKWGGYQSAKLIDDMSKTKDYKEIASHLGIRSQDVTLRHEAFLALKQMKNNINYSQFAIPKLYTLFHELVSSNTFFKDTWLGWDKSKLIFTNIDNVERVYDGLIPDKTGVKEINNPTKLRKFSKLLCDFPTVRAQLERPSFVRMDDVDFDFTEARRLRKIKNFITFINRQNKGDLSSDELEQLNFLSESIQRLLSMEGE